MFVPAPPQRKLIPLLVLLLLGCASALPVIAQQAQIQPNAPSQLKPISVAHLYWHFLIHQSVLDAAAAKLQADGKDGNALRNDLQIRLGFSDAGYAPIRTASQHLALELKPINEQLKALPHSASSTAQAQSLISQREAFISSEMYNLSLELSPQNKTALEKFMADFFAPKQIAVQAPPAGQSTGKAVAK